MNQKPLPVGVDDFEKLITRGYYFVDKSLFIKELLDKKGDVNLFTRPRRFGKTLNMSMLKCFFEDTSGIYGEKVERAYLFENLKIMQCGDGCLQHMGKYPVIFLTLKSAKQPDFESAQMMLVHAVIEEFRRHRHIMEEPRLEEYKEQYFDLMREKAGRNNYKDALRFLSECLYVYYGQKVIILIDEYDVPLESAHLYRYYEQMADFIRSLFESCLKTNSYLEFAVITGCLRISKESIFTGLNNLEVISILSKNYDEYFGFTERETEQICEDYGIPKKYEVLQAWYNGYVFGSASVYNPWSVIQYIDDLGENINVLPKSYWANTSANSIVRSLIERADRDVKDEIEALIAGQTLEKPIHEDITYEEVYQNMDNLWNFMFFTGYFRKVSERMEAGRKYITLAIPNEEVRYIFRDKVLAWFHAQVRRRDQTRLFDAFVRLDAAAVQEEIEDMLLTTISFNDYYESFYHGFLAGILYGMDGYVVKSNREGGTGRTDLFLKPASRRKTAYIVEFKTAARYQQLSQKADEALGQINEKAYDRELLDDGYSAVVHYGIAFFGKNCEVRVR